MSRKPLYATFSPSLVREYLDCFSGNDLKIMKYYYGIDAPKLKVEDISPILNMSINTIYRHLRRLSNSLEIMLQNNEKHTLSSRKKRVTKRIYTSKEIKPLLPYFSGNDLTILKMYYGIDESAKTLEEIEEVIKYDRSGIKKRLNNLNEAIGTMLTTKEYKPIKSLTKKEYNLYQKQTDPKLMALLLNFFPLREQEVLKLYYGIESPKNSQKAIAQKLNLTRQRIYQIIEKNQHKINNILSIIKDLSVMDNNLSVYEKTLLELFVKYQSIEYLSKFFEQAEKTIYTNINNLLTKYFNIIQNNIANYGYKTYQIIPLLKYFSPENQKIIKLYYGINTSPLNITMIAKELKVSYSTLSKHLTNIIQALNTMLETKEYHFYNINYPLIKEQDLTKITPYLKYFTPKDQQIIKLYYGVGTNPHNISDLAQILYYHYSTISRELIFINNALAILRTNSPFREFLNQHNFTYNTYINYLNSFNQFFSSSIVNVEDNIFKTFLKSRTTLNHLAKINALSYEETLNIINNYMNEYTKYIEPQQVLKKGGKNV